MQTIISDEQRITYHPDASLMMACYSVKEINFPVGVSP